MISVVIPVLDGEAFLGEALESARAAGADEVVVVDHGSSDGTREVALGFDFVRLLENADPSLHSSYNMGFAEARGDPVSVLGHDDVYEPGALEALGRALDDGAAVAFGRVCFELVEGAEAPPGFREELLDAARDSMLLETMLATRQALDRVGTMRHGANCDVDWFARLRESGLPVATVPEVVTRKRIRTESEGHRAAAEDPLAIVRVLREAVVRRQGGRA